MNKLHQTSNEEKVNLEELREHAFILEEPKWEPVETAQPAPQDRTKGSKFPRILAQCCKPGPCSPKRH